MMYINSCLINLTCLLYLVDLKKYIATLKHSKSLYLKTYVVIKRWALMLEYNVIHEKMACDVMKKQEHY